MSGSGPERLDFEKLSKRVKSGTAVEVRVRDVLYTIGASRRGSVVVRKINNLLEKNQLSAEPEIEKAWIDGHVKLHQLSDKTVKPDPVYRVGLLEAANRVPVSVKPQSTVKQAVTLMLMYDYSQLPVLKNARSLEGCISWQSLASKLVFDNCGIAVKDCLERPTVLEIDERLVVAAETVAKKGYCLVRAKDSSICGIVTATDLTEQYINLAAPFLLLDEIENGLRILIRGCFDHKVIQSAAKDDGRVIEGVSDLTLGEKVRLIESADNWARLLLPLDRTEFVKCIDRVRGIRNRVMHFEPDGIDEEDTQLLRHTARMLDRVRDNMN